MSSHILSTISVKLNGSECTVRKFINTIYQDWHVTSGQQGNSVAINFSSKGRLSPQHATMLDLDLSSKLWSPNVAHIDSAMPPSSFSYWCITVVLLSSQ